MAPRKDDAIANYHSRNHIIFLTPSLFSHNLSHLTSWHSHHWNDRFYSNFTWAMDPPRTIFDKNFRSKEKRSVLLLGLEPIGGWGSRGYAENSPEMGKWNTSSMSGGNLEDYSFLPEDVVIDRLSNIPECWAITTYLWVPPMTKRPSNMLTKSRQNFEKSENYTAGVGFVTKTMLPNRWNEAVHKSPAAKWRIRLLQLRLLLIVIFQQRTSTISHTNTQSQ